MSELGHNKKMKQAEEHDPVCGMKVDPSEAAASIEHHGATVYFWYESLCRKVPRRAGEVCAAKPGAAPFASDGENRSRKRSRPAQCIRR